jgi:hypothetical protein
MGLYDFQQINNFGGTLQNCQFAYVS